MSDEATFFFFSCALGVPFVEEYAVYRLFKYQIEKRRFSASGRRDEARYTSMDPFDMGMSP